MHGVTFTEQGGNHVMNVSRKALEAGLITHEAMNVDEQQLPSAITRYCIGT